MSLISKQIDDLRTYAKDRKGDIAKLVSEAADTIELLSAKLTASQMERSSQYYHGGWIPCSERLPSNHENKLLTEEVRFVTGRKINRVCMAYYDDENDEWYEVMGEDVETVSYPVAWQELPEPYKGSDRE